MKLRPWLRFSLAFNALLAGALGWLALGRSQPVVRESVSRFITNRVLRVRHKPALPAPVTYSAPAVVEVNEPFLWAQIESTDYHRYIANLRGIGCPEQTVRDFVVAEVDELFEERVKELVDGVTGRFWELLSRPGEFEKVVDQKKNQLDQMQDERRALLSALFGDENPHAEEENQIADAARHESWASLTDFLPEEKRARFIVNRDEFESAQTKLWQTPGLSDTERRTKQKELDETYDRGLRAWLAPEEYDELHLRQSNAAQIRSRLAGLEVSEDEVRALAKCQSAKQNAQLRELLGSERFAAYERTGDYRYSPIQRVTQRVGLPDQIAVQVFDTRRTAEDRARQVAQNPSFSDDEREATLQAIGEETRRSISDALGAKACAAYERLDGGWLQQLSSTRH